MTTSGLSVYRSRIRLCALPSRLTSTQRLVLWPRPNERLLHYLDGLAFADAWGPQRSTAPSFALPCLPHLALLLPIFFFHYFALCLATKPTQIKNKLTCLRMPTHLETSTGVLIARWELRSILTSCSRSLPYHPWLLSMGPHQLNSLSFCSRPYSWYCALHLVSG